MKNFRSPHFEIKDLQKICITETSDIEKVRNAITISGMEAICHVDKNGVFKGITSDSDLRKSNTNIINHNPKFIYNESSKVGLINDYIPVLNFKKELKSVMFRPREQVLKLIDTPTSVSIIGVGYVGLTLGIALAIKGIKVYCFDKDYKIINLLKNGEIPFYESGIKESFDLAKSNLVFLEMGEPINTSEVIVTVGTPLKKDKSLNTKYLFDAIDGIIKYGQKKTIQNIILRSTVPLGTCDYLKRKLSDENKLDIEIVMCPERTIEGEAIKELSTNPQIIGSYSLNACLKSYKLFSLLTNFVHISNDPKFAELAKLGDNTYRDIKFAFSNFLAITAQKLNLVGSEVIEVMNQGYSRNDLATPSPGVGGPCLSKDAFLFKSGLDKFNIPNSSFILGGRNQDDSVIEFLSETVRAHCKFLNTKKISIAGLSFKGFPETSDSRDSSTLKLISKLKDEFKISVFDPIANDLNENEYYERENYDQFCINSGALIIMNNNPYFKSIDWDVILKSLLSKALVIDGWNILERFNVAVSYDLVFKQI